VATWTRSLLYDELSGMENLRYFAGLYGLHDDVVGRHAMQMVGLDPELTRRVGQYSQACDSGCRWRARCCTIPS